MGSSRLTPSLAPIDLTPMQWIVAMPRRWLHFLATLPWHAILERSPLLLIGSAGLAPFFWFSHGLPIKGVDSFFSLRPQERLFPTVFSSAWDSQMSAGEPRQGHIYLLVNGLQAGLSSLGLPLSVTQAVILVLFAASSVTGMFLLLTLLLPGPRLVRGLGAACGAVCWVANPFTLSFVWFHQLLTEVTWAVVPWLLVLAIVAARQLMGPQLYVPLLLIVGIVGASGISLTYLPAILILLVAFLVGAVISERALGHALLGAGIFLATFMLSISWSIVPSVITLSQTYADEVSRLPAISEFLYASKSSDLANVVSLTAIPQLYAKFEGVRYISWAWFIDGGPGQILRFVLPIVALGGALFAVRSRTQRPIAISLSCCVVAAAMLSKGLNPPFGTLNLALLGLPFGGAFRHPVDKFAVLLVMPMCVLFAHALTELFRRATTAPLGFVASLTVIGIMAAPWWSGSVIPNGAGLIPSARVQVPKSYQIIGSALSKAPVGGKTFVLPYSIDQEAAFHWTSGVQPNADCLFQDWSPERTLVCHEVGSQFANRVGNTVQKALTNSDPRVLELARIWGIDRWLIHEDWNLDFMPSPQIAAVTPVVADTFFANPWSQTPAQSAVRKAHTVSLPAEARSVVIYVRINHLPASAEDRLLQIGTADLQVNRSVPYGIGAYLALYDQHRLLWDEGKNLSLGKWHMVVLQFSNNRIFLSVDGADQSQVKECSPGPPFPMPCNLDRGRGMALDPRPQSIIVPSRESRTAIADITEPAPTISANPRPVFMGADRVPYPHLLESTVELRLWQQEALPLIYAGTTNRILDSSSTDSLLSGAHAVASDSAPVLVEPSHADLRLDQAATTSWRMANGTDFRGVLEVHGSSMLVFLQSYDPGWRLVVSGNGSSVSSHVVVNGFANGWLVNGSGNVPWELVYAPQRAFIASYIVGIVLLVSAIVALAMSLRPFRHRALHQQVPAFRYQRGTARK